jgi:asparagine synthase (glutamine-hydrolysing)
MSVQFGKINLDGTQLDATEFDRVRPMIARYGSDGEGEVLHHNVGVIFRAFHTTKESRLERQPYGSESGVIICWDGRLDNRDDLIKQMGGQLSSEATDLQIVVAAYERWQAGCFPKLIGDWAVSIWDRTMASLILARDFIGNRHLYYAVEQNHVTWCSILDPLVLLSGRALQLDERYLAGWISFFPEPHLTPYIGVQSVPPSSYVCLGRTSQSITRYWDFVPEKRIRYRTDGEYEEHFRSVFAQSIHRRLRSDCPVVAELSGGMDSSSIVCMADEIAATASAVSELDTVSYYDDSEPNWDELNYFTSVERKRGRSGTHIHLDADGFFTRDNTRFAAAPGSHSSRAQSSKCFAALLRTRGYKVLLSGLGGDEVMGGVPSPTSELADLLTQRQYRRMVHQLKLWALTQKKPWFHLFFDTLREFMFPSLVRRPSDPPVPAWLNNQFQRRNDDILRGYPARLKLMGPDPSFQSNVRTINALRRQLTCTIFAGNPPVQTSYPYLDRCLLEFLFAIPREQLVRPGERRSLMRRSLARIVPADVLQRPRKAFVSRAASGAILNQLSRMEAANKLPHCVELGIIDSTRVQEAFRKLKLGYEMPLVPLIRLIALELWLEHLCQRGEIAHNADASGRREGPQFNSTAIMHKRHLPAS